ncbi:MAG TPA: sigma-70 family RNA polymerase sigma factor [Armatimonadota bacterium]|nr:sigma-70 family RNA polymerase sigma factor [Armatimonadota bacterium]
MAVSDERLARQALRGDAGAFDTLVRRYYPRVLGLCRKMLRSRDVAHDAAQEALVRAYSKLHLYDPDRRFSAWLMTVTARVCVSLGQKSARDPQPWEEIGEADGGPADETPGPVEHLVKTELTGRVGEAVQSLPDLYKPVCVLRHVEGLSYAEISEATGLPIGTVKVHLHRAKKHLREELRDLVELELSNG